MRRVISQGFERLCCQINVQDSLDFFEKCITHHDWTQRQVQKHARIFRETVYIRKEYITPITEPTLDSVLREISDAHKAARSTSTNFDRGLADHVPKRQPDLATRVMLEQASLSSHGDYEQSTILHLSRSHVPLSDDLLSLVQSKRTRPFSFSFSSRKSWEAMDVSDTSSMLTSADPDEYDGHNILNPDLQEPVSPFSCRR